jgi:hypothetical protein
MIVVEEEEEEEKDFNVVDNNAARFDVVMVRVVVQAVTVVEVVKNAELMKRILVVVTIIVTVSKSIFNIITLINRYYECCIENDSAGEVSQFNGIER